MDVTNHNFLEALTLFKTHLADAHFVAIDLEFTGLGESRPSQLDTPAVRYRTARDDAERFPPIQFGIAVFKRVRGEAAEQDARRRTDSLHHLETEEKDLAHVVARDSESQTEPAADRDTTANGEGETQQISRNAHDDVRDLPEGSGQLEGIGGGDVLANNSFAVLSKRNALRNVGSPSQNTAARNNAGGDGGPATGDGRSGVSMDVDFDVSNAKGDRHVSTSANVDVQEENIGERVNVRTGTVLARGDDGVASPPDRIQNVCARRYHENEPVTHDSGVNGVLADSEKRRSAMDDRAGMSSKHGVEGVIGGDDVHWDGQWQVVPFNFNIFPRAVYYPQNARYPKWDRIFSLQSSTVSFLLKHGFDFHKICHGGVGWIREDVEQELREHVSTMLRKSRSQTKNDASEADKEVVPKYREMVNEWVQKLGDGTNIKMFPLPKTGIQRRLVYDMIRDRYPRVLARNLMTQEGLQLKLTRFADEKEAKRNREEALITEIEEEISKHVGFRYVLDAVRKAQIPIVAHNAMLDLAKVYANFVESMPESLGEFKARFREHFPLTYDTRLMLSEIGARLKPQVKSEKHNSISDTVEFVKEALKKMGRQGVEPLTFVPIGKIYNYGSHLDKGFMKDKEAGFTMNGSVDEEEVKYDFYEFLRYSGSSREHYEHEAGFDALETGRLFIMLLQLARAGDKFFRYDNFSEHLLGVRNRIFLGSCGGYRYIDLEVDSEDEHNDYLEKSNAIVISGVLKEGGVGTVTRSGTSPYHRLRHTLTTLTMGTSFDSAASSFVTVGPESMLALLTRKGECEKEGSGKRVKGIYEQRAQDIQMLITRGQELGVRVEPYESAVKHVDASIKRRKIV